MKRTIWMSGRVADGEQACGDCMLLTGPRAPRRSARLVSTTALLASTAFAALLLGSGGAGAACYSGPFPATISGTETGICVVNTSFDGVLDNTGTITTDGITLTNSQIGSAVSFGKITSSGTLSGGITLDASSSITARVALNGAIEVRGPFSGGIHNAGTIDGFNEIDARNFTSFTGGITNSGSINAIIDAIFLVGGGSTFFGGITNSGAISFDMGSGVDVQSNFVGDIVNTATSTITWNGVVTGPGRGVFVTGVSSFDCGIINAGSIVNSYDGIYVDHAGSFGGTTGIVNTGSITAQTDGIFVGSSVATPTGTVTGGISNSGTISAGIGIALNNVTSFSGGISNGGTITAPGFGTGIFLANVGSLSGNIVNTGTITAGNAIQINSGVNFVGGAAIINSGIIAGSSSAINAQSATGPVTIVQTAGQITGDISLSSNADTVTVTGGAIAGNMFGAGTSNTLNFNLGRGSFVYDSAYRLTGFHQLNVNSGTVALNGANDATDVAVNGGALLVGDAGHAGATLTSTNPVSVLGTLSGYGTVIGDVAVGAGGVLSGFGTVNGNVSVVAGGLLAPGGGGTGTLTITGSLTMASSATYLVQFSGASNSKTAVSGAAALGGTLVLGGTAQPGTYVILTASGVGGSFSGITNTVTGVSNPHLVYLSNEVDLVLGPATVLTPGLPRNPLAVGTPLDNILRKGGTLPGGLQTLPNLSGTDLANALTLLDGEAATGAQHSAFQTMTSFLGLMSDPFVEGRGGGALGFAATDQTLPSGVASAYAAVLKAAPAKAPRFEQRWSVWGGAYGGGNSTDGDPMVVGSHDLAVRAAGFAAGADYRLTPSATAGFALAGGNSNWSLAQGLGGGRNDAFQAGLHGRTTMGPAYVSVAFAAAEHWLSTSRTALAGSQLSARFNAQSYGGRLEVGYRLTTPVTAVTPYAALQMLAFTTPGYGEIDGSGGGFGLNYAGRTARDTRGEVGARFDGIVALNPTALMTLRGKLGYAHDWVSDPSLTAVFQALPGASFIVTGAAPARDSLLASGGAELLLASGWVLAAKFDGEFAAHSRTYTGTGTLRYTW